MYLKEIENSPNLKCNGCKSGTGAKVLYFDLAPRDGRRKMRCMDCWNKEKEAE